jgi:dihydroorotase
VREGTLDLAEALRKMTCNPARILNIPGGDLQEGGRADLAIINTDVEYVMREDDFFSKSRNSPFIGKSLRGRNELTMMGGKIVWQKGGTHPGS